MFKKYYLFISIQLAIDKRLLQICRAVNNLYLHVAVTAVIIHVYILFQLLFVLYMAIVAILLVNMLIAMMGNTYQKIAERKNEWQRQVRRHIN